MVRASIILQQSGDASLWSVRSHLHRHVGRGLTANAGPNSFGEPVPRRGTSSASGKWAQVDASRDGGWNFTVGGG